MITEPTANDYRMTELGPLPPEWRVVRLGEVTSIGKNSRKQEERQIIPFIPMSLIPENSIYISEYEFRSQNQIRSGVIISEGDFLLAKITPCFENGKQGIVKDISGGWGYATTEIFSIRPERELLTEFLALYFLRPEIRQYLATKMEGATGRQRLPKAVVQSLIFPLPPLAEQRAIAHTLRAAQQAKLSSERMVAALRTVKQSLMHHLFRYGPVPLAECDRVPLRETPLGPLPAHWQVVRLGEVFSIQQGKSLSSRSRTGERMRPFLRTANVHWGKIDITLLDMMHFDESEEKKLKLEINDLLICEGGDIGRTAIWKEQVPLCYYQNHLYRLRAASTNAFPLFYMYWMYAGWILFKLYGGIENKTTIPNLSQSRLVSLLIPLPPLAEQQRIAAILQAVDRRIAAAESRVRALADLFATLLRDLMTARRRIPPEVVAQFAG